MRNFVNHVPFVVRREGGKGFGIVDVVVEGGRLVGRANRSVGK